MQSISRWMALSAVGVVLGLGGCASQSAQEELTMAKIVDLQKTGSVQPFNQLNTDVIARHPGSEVAHAALDKEGERYLYQATLVDPNKMEWYVEIDAKTGEPVTDRQV